MTKYLDEEIIARVNVVSQRISTKTDTFAVYIGNDLIYTGVAVPVIVDNSHFYFEIYLNDILSNYAYNKSEYVDGESINNLLVNVRVAAVDYTGEANIPVALFYRYPNRKSYLEKTLETDYGNMLQGGLLPSIPFIPTNKINLPFVIQNDAIRNFAIMDDTSLGTLIPKRVQGASIKTYLPDYLDWDGEAVEEENPKIYLSEIEDPVERADQYTLDEWGTGVRTVSARDFQFGQCGKTFEITYRGSAKSFTLTEEGETVQVTFDFTYNNLELGIYIEAEDNPGDGFIQFDFTDRIYDEVPNGYRGKLTLSVTLDEASQDVVSFYVDSLTSYSTKPVKKTPLANIDECPADYYLLWQDRYGGVQCQGFRGNSFFSADYEKEFIEGLYFKNNLRHNSVKPKWTLQSQFINENEFPNYESILVSPWLKLYDTKEDLIYEVNIKDSSFTEHSFKRERKMFTLALNLESTSKQNLIY